MRVSSSSLLILLPAACWSFATPTFRHSPGPTIALPSTTALASTLARPDVPTSSPSSSPKHPDSILATGSSTGDIKPISLSGKGALSMDLDELGQVLGGRGRAQIAWDCYTIGIDPQHFYGSVIRLGYDDYESIYSMLPNSRRSQRLGKDALEKLSALYPTTGGKVEDGVASLSHISRSKDGTTKLLLKLHDGLTVETVIIPWKGGRSTLCVSSQVGCRQGCTFCATGRMGRLRNLSSDEILAQMFFAKKICRLEDLPEVTNIVYMGMGDASDNVDNVLAATEILTKRELFQLSASRVTVSTVAPTPSAFLQFAKAPCVLAWSVHAANDDLRKRLVPTTKYPMSELRQGLIDALLQRPMNFRTTMLEVALMDGVNDSLEAADEMADFAQVIVDSVPGCKLIVNLIPYNDIGQQLYKKPKMENVKAFQRHLQSRRIYCKIREARGDDKTAACGQLATSKNPIPAPTAPVTP